MTSIILLKSILYAKALQKSKKKKKKEKIKVVHKIHRDTNVLTYNKIREISIHMCRTCNQEKGNIPIFNNSKQTDIAEEIHNISGIALSNTDNLSKHMCQNCIDLLNGCIMFREMCQRTNKTLVELSIKKEDNTKEIVTEAQNEEEDVFNVPSPMFSEIDDNSEVWSCTSCHKEYHDMRSYNNHLFECDPQTPYVPKCEEKKKFLCDTCGKTANSKASLLSHMNTHENIFPFKCEQCPYQGRTIDLLKVHKRSHLAEKPYKCSFCPKTTTTSSNLAKHVRHVHSTTRPYKCTYCDKAFSSNHDMNRHIRDIHLRQGTVECDVCYKKFNTKKILQGHKWKIHKIKGERHGRLPSYLRCQAVESNENDIPTDLIG